MGKTQLEENENGNEKDKSLMKNYKKYLQFNLGSELYAIYLLDVMEVITPPTTTTLPNSPNYFEGVINLRGQIISIFDLRKKLNISSECEQVQEAVIIVNIEGIKVGLIVDSINKVFHADFNTVYDIPELKGQINGKFIEGIYKHEDQLTVLLNMSQVLDIQIIDQVMNKAS